MSLFMKACSAFMCVHCWNFGQKAGNISGCGISLDVGSVYADDNIDKCAPYCFVCFVLAFADLSIGRYAAGL